MINGRYDHVCNLDRSVRPFFELFGAPEEDKRLALFDAGHFGFPISAVLTETLDWLDRYLGPVEKIASAATATGGL